MFQKYKENGRGDLVARDKIVAFWPPLLRRPSASQNVDAPSEKRCRRSVRRRVR